MGAVVMIDNHDKIGLFLQSSLITYGALTLQELAIIIGFVATLVQLGVNTYYKRQENRRREEAHEQKMSENKR